MVCSYCIMICEKYKWSRLFVFVTEIPNKSRKIFHKSKYLSTKRNTWNTFHQMEPHHNHPHSCFINICCLLQVGQIGLFWFSKHEDSNIFVLYFEYFIVEFYHFTKHWHWLGLPSYQPSDYVWKLPRSELIRKRNECHIWKFKYQSIKISSSHHKFRKVTSPLSSCSFTIRQLDADIDYFHSI